MGDLRPAGTVATGRLSLYQRGMCAPGGDRIAEAEGLRNWALAAGWSGRRSCWPGAGLDRGGAGRAFARARGVYMCRPGRTWSNDRIRVTDQDDVVLGDDDVGLSLIRIAGIDDLRLVQGAG